MERSIDVSGELVAACRTTSEWRNRRSFTRAMALRGIEGDIMRYKKAVRLGGFVVCLGTSAALVGAATGATGAFFSDTKSGKITGRSGSIKVSTEGSTNSDGSAAAGPGFLDLSFDGLLPGEPQSVIIHYANTGNSPEDVWLTFPNVPALHALNNLGRYGELTLTNSLGGEPDFHSTNLNDGRTGNPGNLIDAGTDSCGTLSAIPPACWPLPNKIKVRSALPKGGSGTVTFTFKYQEAPGPSPFLHTPVENNVANVLGGFDWNSYPANQFGGEAFGPDAAGSADKGLPMNVVAMQAGRVPNP